MRKIIKGTEPASLTKHRRIDKTDYEGYREKDQLRKALVKEQRGICCYCMGRITPKINKMKIEHFLSHSGHPDERLVYSNLFGACLGNMNADAEKHCDTLKKSKEFHFHMCSSGNIHTDIEYRNDGVIFSNIELLNKEIGGEYDELKGKFTPGVLNLNISGLINARKNTLQGFIDTYLKIGKGKLNKEMLVRQRDKWSGVSNDDELQPYCMIVVYYIEKKLAKL